MAVISRPSFSIIAKSNPKYVLGLFASRREQVVGNPLFRFVSRGILAGISCEMCLKLNTLHSKCQGQAN
jgi:hypothetical protein